MKYTERKKRNVSYILPKIKAPNQLLSFGRHQTTTCTYLFSDFIIYCGFMQLTLKTSQTVKTHNVHALALNFFYCHNWVITINQKPYESWGMTWQIQQISLIRVFAVCSMGNQGSKVTSCGQRRLWSDWVDAQADLSLRWAPTHFVGFVMSQLIWH